MHYSSAFTCYMATLNDYHFIRHSILTLLSPFYLIRQNHETIHSKRLPCSSNIFDIFLVLWFPIDLNKYGSRNCRNYKSKIELATSLRCLSLYLLTSLIFWRVSQSWITGLNFHWFLNFKNVTRLKMDEKMV